MYQLTIVESSQTSKYAKNVCISELENSSPSDSRISVISSRYSPLVFGSSRAPCSLACAAKRWEVMRSIGMR